jgi:choline transport protein
MEKSEAIQSLSATEAGSPVGQSIDDQAIQELGYKPELQRRFGMWSMIGLSCSIMITWEGWFTIFGVNLTDGGPAGCVYAFLFVWLGYTVVVSSLSELVSMMPTAAGQ